MKKFPVQYTIYTYTYDCDVYDKEVNQRSVEFVVSDKSLAERALKARIESRGPYVFLGNYATHKTSKTYGMSVDDFIAHATPVDDDDD